MTKQFGSIDYQMDMAATELLASTLSATYIEALNSVYGVAKHDDSFLPGDGVGGYSAPFYNAGQSFGTVEEIDLRKMFSDGMILEDIRLNLQRTFDKPIVNQMWNIDPSAEIFESVIVTTDPYPVAEADDELNLFQWHQSGFRPLQYATNNYLGMGVPESLVFQQTRIYKHDQSRAYSGDTYANYTTPPTGPATILYSDLVTTDETIRGYPDFLSAPTLYIYRIFSVWYYARSPTMLSQTAIDQQTARMYMWISPMQITLSGEMRKGTDSERIMKATDSLLRQPTRPAASRP